MKLGHYKALKKEINVCLPPWNNGQNTCESIIIVGNNNVIHVATLEKENNQRVLLGW